MDPGVKSTGVGSMGVGIVALAVPNCVVLPLAGVFRLPTLVIELCARFWIEGESLRVLRLVWVSVLAWPWSLAALSWA